MKKKIIIAFMVMLLSILAFGVINVSAETEGIYTYTVSNGEATITDCDTSACGEIVIPDTLDNLPVTTIYKQAFWGCKNITSIVIPNGVTSIGYGAFYSCTNLTNITIPDSVISIGNDAFSWCRSLTNVTLGDNVTGIGNDAFYNCTSLTSVTIPNSVTSIGDDAFGNCTSLTSVNITDISSWCNIDFYSRDSNPLYFAKNLYLNNELVTNLAIPDSLTEIKDYTFQNCINLISVDIPNTITKIGVYGFAYCTNLANVELPDSLIDIGDYCFYGCTGLTNITIPGSVASIGKNAFYVCRNIESLNITNIKSYLDCEYGNEYSNPMCYADNLYLNEKPITQLDVPNSVTQIPNYAFNNCSSLESVTIPAGVISIGKNAFYGCTGITSITIPNGVTSIGESAFYGCSGLTDIVIPNGVTSIERNTFYGCTNLTNITIPSSLTFVGDDAFRDCSALSNLYIDDLKAYLNINFEYTNTYMHVTGIPADNIYLNNELLTEVVIPDGIETVPRYAFSGKVSISSITIPDGVNSIGMRSFAGCTALTSITIPSSVTFVGEYAFDRCENLTNVYISDLKAYMNIEFDDATYFSPVPTYYANNLYLNNELLTEVVIPDGIETIPEYMFCYNTNITSITIPDGVTSIGGSAFSGCDGLTSITIPDSITSIGESAFCDCTDLTSITIPDGVSSIEDYTFCNCSSLTSITIPDNVTSIGYQAFSNCTSLASITIPDSVTSIGGSAFRNCTGLTRVNISDITSWCNISFSVSNSNPLYYAKKLYLNGSLITQLTIPDSVTTIGNDAFRNCTDLTSVTIPGSVTSIGNYAFFYCTGLIRVYYNGTEENWNNISIGSSNHNLTNATKHYFYYVTLINENGNEISKKMYDVNTLVDISDIEEKFEHTIHFYTDEECKTEYDLSTQISENLTLYLKYIPNQYLSKFVDYDGNIIWEDLLDYGTIIAPPESPERERTQQYTYTFAGWDGFEDGITQTNQEMVFTATYNATVNQYTYKFIDEVGSVLKEVTVDYGTVIEPPVVPTKENTAQYTYSFAGWDGYTSGMTLEDDIEFTAIYNETINQYTYKFIDDNGDVLKEETVDYGTAIVAPETPADKDAYTFDYWEGFSDGMTAVGDITFKAVYKYKIYNVSVFGYEDLKTDVIYNRNYTITPAGKYGYEFLGYYSEENGNGTKLTNEAGNSLAVYNTEDDSVVYPYFKDLLCNKVVVSGTDTVTIGDTDVRYTVSLGTDKENIYYTTIKVKYPKAFILEDVVNKKFDETEIIEITEREDYNIAEILCVYSYDGNAIPTLTPIDAFELCFNVDKTSKVQNVTVEITNDSILMGETDDYQFDGFVNASVSIQPKLAESITIDGFSQINAPTQYTATVYPDYTTDKTVVWSVSDENVATISDDGVLTPVKNGAVTITATANDGSEVFATKTVDVIAYAQITSISTNGTWTEEFKNGKRNYTIYVGEEVTTFDISARYSKGTLRVNGSTLLSGRSKTVELTGDETTITVERLNVDEMTDITYTLTVIKSSDALISEVKTTENGYEFNIILNKDNVETFETAKLVVALYDGSGKFIGLSPVDVNGSDTKKVVPIETETPAYAAKVMLWSELETLKPLCNSTEITLK